MSQDTVLDTLREIATLLGGGSTTLTPASYDDVTLTYNSEDLLAGVDFYLEGALVGSLTLTYSAQGNLTGVERTV
jgi:hypothetical protein